MSDNLEFLNSIAFSEKLDSSDRQVILQTALTRYLKSKKDDHTAIGNWLAGCAKEYADDFKSSIIPLISTLDSEKITGLETLTNLTLKVVTDHSTLTP